MTKGAIFTVLIINFEMCFYSLIILMHEINLKFEINNKHMLAKVYLGIQKK